jgi:hypothetical protein
MFTSENDIPCQEGHSNCDVACLMQNVRQVEIDGWLQKSHRPKFIFLIKCRNGRKIINFVGMFPDGETIVHNVEVYFQQKVATCIS